MSKWIQTFQKQSEDGCKSLLDYEIKAEGEHGTKPLRVGYHMEACTIKSLGTFATGSEAWFDWYNDHLQILFYEGMSDEVALYFRLNEDGTVAEIVVREDLLPLVIPEPTEMTLWSKRRDRITDDP